nr:PaaI family thioesterase [Sagittula sp. MA-2]
MPMDDDIREGPYAFSALLGMEMADWRQDYARFELPLADKLMNRHGNPHGGVYASLLDTIMGYAGCWTGDRDRRQMCLKLNLNVQFISRPKGEMLIGEGFRTGGGKSTFFAEGVLKDETGEVVAKGTGVFRYRRGA